MNTRFFLRIILPVVALLMTGSLASAQATRTWVSGVGDDVNPCSRTAPCKTFAGAYSKTAAGGEIDALDPGGYGALTISKAINIVGTGTNASVLAATGSNGIVVAAGPSDRVSIQGLSILGAGSGANGIRFISGASVHVEDCRIYGFTGSGIDIEIPNSHGYMYVRNSSLFQNAIGLTIVGGSVSTGAIVEGTTLEENTTENINISGSNSVLNLINSSVEGSVGIVESGSPAVYSNGKNSILGGGTITTTVPVE